MPTSEVHLEQVFGGKLPSEKHVLVKNIVFKDKKKNLFLVVTHDSAMFDPKLLASKIGAKGSMRMANEDVLETVLGTSKGSVSPLAVMNDSENVMQVIIDSSVDSAEIALVHPGSNTATIAVSVEQLKEFITGCGNSVQIIDLSGAAKGTVTEAPKPKAKKAAKPVVAEKIKTEEENNRALLGIEASKTDDFNTWYTQVVTRSEMIDYYDVSGCYILRPWSYFIWEQIQNYFDAGIKKSGVRNAYFPLFVSEAALKREENHLEGFAPEVAWVTHAGSSELAEKIAIRPTSETIIYQSFSKWIKSHRDLPMRMNQWSNVVRWEFKNPTPFIRSREFLWQEGHSAFATEAEADLEVYEILDLYAMVYEDLLAIPVTKGIKSEKEKFAGANYTTTVEIFVPAAGRGIQAATSHCLGQNFAKMFDITFEDTGAKSQMVWQNSWGLSTRSIGAMVMVHGDDKGLVLPPKVAPVQVVFVPIYFKDEQVNAGINAKINELADLLKKAGVRAECDLREVYNPGWKYNHWEVRGVPIRVEVGPRDLKNGQAVLVRRDDGSKKSVEFERFVENIIISMDEMHASMFKRAQDKANPLVFTVKTWSEFLVALTEGGRALCLWCNEVECEMDVRGRSGVESEATKAGLSGGAKSLCIPLEQPELPENATCFACAKKAVNWTMFGRSY